MEDTTGGLFSAQGPKTSEVSRKALAVAALVAFLLLGAGGCVAAARTAELKLDLRKFGFLLGTKSSVLDCTELNFLSDSLLAVTINQARMEPVMPLDFDHPESTLLLVNLATGEAAITGKIAVEKSGGAVKAVAGGRLAIWNEDGLRLCTADLRCGTVIAGRGPIFVSPQGKRIVFGGRRLGAVRMVIDTRTFRPIASFTDSAFGYFGWIVPGDTGLLYSRDGDGFVVQRPGEQDKRFDFADKGLSGESQFLNDNAVAYIAYVDQHSADAVVARVDGGELHRHRLDEPFRAEFLTTAEGRRFGIYEYGYTFWNSAVNFLDLDAGRAKNLQRLRVFDITTGQEVAEFEWDPRPYLITPALSPNGRRFARVAGTVLEVIKID